MVNPSSAIEPAGVLSRRPARNLRAPLVWLTLALCSGYSLNRFLPGISPAWLLAPGCLLALLAWRQCRSSLWIPVFLGAATLLAWSWANLRSTQLPEDWESLPPRELFAEVLVEEIYDGKMYPDYKYVIARVLGSELPRENLNGERFFGSFRQDEETIPLAKGALYRVRGVIQAELADSPGADAFGSFLRIRNTHFRLRHGSVLEEVRPPPLYRRIGSAVHAQWLDWLTAASEQRKPQANLLAGMLLGERDLLSPEQEERFVLSGTMHLFAISGLHVMVVALTLQMAIALVPMPRAWRYVLVLLLLGGYVLVTGASPSALRAFIMVAFVWLGLALSRASFSVAGILCSAVVVLIIAPTQLFSIGFQLSYSVVLSILLFGLPLTDALKSRFTPYRWIPESDLRSWQRLFRSTQRRIIDSLSISLAATVASAPLIILHYNILSPGAILLNALLVPLAGLVVSVGVIMLILHPVGLGLAAAFFAHGAWLVLLVMEEMIRHAVALPGTHGERIWKIDACAYILLAIFLLSLFGIHHRALSDRLSPFIRLSAPLLIMTTGILFGTQLP